MFTHFSISCGEEQERATLINQHVSIDTSIKVYLRKSYFLIYDFLISYSTPASALFFQFIRRGIIFRNYLVISKFQELSPCSKADS